MRTASIAQAKSQLSALISQAAAGEEIVITKHGRAVARLVAEPAQPFGWEALAEWVKQEELHSMTVEEMRARDLL